MRKSWIIVLIILALLIMGAIGKYAGPKSSDCHFQAAPPGNPPGAITDVCK
jgi:hypothetical protein